MKTHSGIILHLLVMSFGRMSLSQEDHSAQGTGNQEKWEGDLQSASSLEELLRLINFPDWKLWRCRLKLKHLEQPLNPEQNGPSSSSSQRTTRGTATPITDEILQAIDNEWQKTRCMPRETCVDVANELGSSPDMFFKPPCVSVFRCGGCCNREGVTCRNTSTTYVDKTLFTVVSINKQTHPVLIKVANHTECECMEPAVIRRHVHPSRFNGCSSLLQTLDPKNTRSLCPRGLIWDCTEDQCIPYPSRKRVGIVLVQKKVSRRSAAQF
ncbi:vascular endothelial growth factor D-like [Megalops cyprinoides]|uniref:vascular endothelial growth factor D-like n=1 Tax=Megalops cyprinoides TaxID=118141 RepID=UPI00186435DD|nr:vascular endothelial growth factor D-like [Megalops cyprinoides]